MLNWDFVLREGLKFQDVRYNPDMFSASGGMTWTVEAADLITYKYCQFGRMLFIGLDVETSSVSGGSDTLFVRLPNNFISSAEMHSSCHLAITGVGASGHADLDVGDDFITIQLIPAANFPAIVDDLHIGLQLFAEIREQG